MLVFRMPLGMIGRKLVSWEDIDNRIELAKSFAELILNEDVRYTIKDFADISIIQTWYESDNKKRKQKTFYFSAVE